MNHRLLSEQAYNPLRVRELTESSVGTKANDLLQRNIDHIFCGLELCKDGFGSGAEFVGKRAFLIVKESEYTEFEENVIQDIVLPLAIASLSCLRCLMRCCKARYWEPRHGSIAMRPTRT